LFVGEIAMYLWYFSSDGFPHSTEYSLEVSGMDASTMVRDVHKGGTQNRHLKVHQTAWLILAPVKATGTPPTLADNIFGSGLRSSISQRNVQREVIERILLAR
jgi:hypothetical protein